MRNSLIQKPQRRHAARLLSGLWVGEITSQSAEGMEGEGGGGCVEASPETVIIWSHLIFCFTRMQPKFTQKVSHTIIILTEVKCFKNLWLETRQDR